MVPASNVSPGKHRQNSGADGHAAKRAGRHVQMSLLWRSARLFLQRQFNMLTGQAFESSVRARYRIWQQSWSASEFGGRRMAHDRTFADQQSWQKLLTFLRGGFAGLLR